MGVAFSLRYICLVSETCLSVSFRRFTLLPPETLCQLYESARRQMPSAASSPSQKGPVYPSSLVLSPSRLATAPGTSVPIEGGTTFRLNSDQSDFHPQPVKVTGQIPDAPGSVTSSPACSGLCPSVASSDDCSGCNVSSASSSTCAEGRGVCTAETVGEGDHGTSAPPGQPDTAAGFCGTNNVRSRGSSGGGGRGPEEKERELSDPSIAMLPGERDEGESVDEEANGDTLGFQAAKP